MCNGDVLGARWLVLLQKMIFCDFVFRGGDGLERFSNSTMYCFTTFTCNGSFNDGV